ncbi:MAG TPA: efflux transporter outer membrane subunit [Steroidobacteraceae bacterium]|nr:efflux transporter outer membrane subunit [Steroidobacteraceae bacterium]
MKRINLITITAVAVAMLSLGGCFVSSVSPQKPELPLPSALPAPAATAADLPDPWWTIFGDTALNSLIEEALAHNTDVAIAAARVEQARASLRIANADRLPSLDVQGDVTRSKASSLLAPVPAQDREVTTYTVQGAVGFELDFWGQYTRASQSARAQLLNSEYGREATKLSLTGDVARAYFGLIAAAEQLARGRDTLATREESVKLEQLRLNAGESDEFTFKRALAEAAATRVSLHQLELEVVQRGNALAVLLGRSPKDMVDNAIASDGINLPAAVTLPAALPSTILERRPDIGAAEAALNASAFDIGVARAQLFPSIRLTGAYGSVSPELSDLFKEPYEAWSIAGSLFQPIFEGGRLRANVKRAYAVREERKAQYARAVQVAFRDVLNSLHGQELIAAVRDATREQTEALQRATELAELRYDQGDISYLELLDVRRGFYQAQISLIAAERDALLNTVDLALAVGGGLGTHAEALSARR